MHWRGIGMKLLFIGAGLMLLMLIISLFQRGNIRKRASLAFRPPLESDNLNDTLRLNRLIANPLVLVLIIACIDAAAIGLFSFCVNVFCDIPGMIKDPEHLSRFIAWHQMLPEPWEHGSFVYGLYLGFYALLLAIDIKMGYMMRDEKRNDVADKKYGENHMKTSAQLGLCQFKNEYRVSCCAEQFRGGKG